MNLMLNALEAMWNEGGELIVKSQQQAGQLLFSVSDTGPGLPTGNVDQIVSASLPSRKAAAWDWPSAAPLRSRMVADCGQLPRKDEVQLFISPCRQR